MLSLNGLSNDEGFEAGYDPPLGSGLGGVTVIITREIELSSITLVTLGSRYSFFLFGPIISSLLT